MSYSSDVILQASNLGKYYSNYARPADRITELFLGQPSANKRWVLRGISFALRRGESLGVIGLNGAGKSTLLQLVARTLQPSEGRVESRGRVSALLELGAGFDPDFTGRENARLNALLMGIEPRDIEMLLPEIIDFSGLGEAIDRPVRTFSSGMYVRLAFSVATALDPDILVIDEALSVGDGSFARKSFDRIMKIKDKGATLLFCSHALYQVEMLCSKTLWLRNGEVAGFGHSAAIIAQYNEFLQQNEEGFLETEARKAIEGPRPETHLAEAARLIGVRARVSGTAVSNQQACLMSEKDDLEIFISFSQDSNMPPAVVALVFNDSTSRAVSSCSTFHDNHGPIPLHGSKGDVTVTFPRLALMKGRYTVDVFLLCERAIHVYEHSVRVLELFMMQDGSEVGTVFLQRRWGAP